MSDQLALPLDIGAICQRSAGPARFRAGSRVLEVTECFDVYWRFAAERQRIFHRRASGMPAPWTGDPILARHKFTSVYRAADRVSQYLIREVIYAGPQDQDEMVFRVLLLHGPHCASAAPAHDKAAPTSRAILGCAPLGRASRPPPVRQVSRIGDKPASRWLP